ncbi:MAG TPA: DUF5658 family protein [Chloroflexota bacterium]
MARETIRRRGMSSLVALGALFLFLQSMDVATTQEGLRAGLPEANPIAAWFIANHGVLGMYALKVASTVGTLAGVFWLQYRGGNGVLVLGAITALVAVVVTSNAMLIGGGPAGAALAMVEASLAALGRGAEMLVLLLTRSSPGVY